MFSMCKLITPTRALNLNPLQRTQNLVCAKSTRRSRRRATFVEGKIRDHPYHKYREPWVDSRVRSGNMTIRYSGLRERDKGEYEPNKLETYIYQLSQLWKKKGYQGEYKLTLFDKSGISKVSTRWFDIGQGPNIGSYIGMDDKRKDPLFDIAKGSDYLEKIPEIHRVSIILKLPAQGGAGKNNDCLWECLKQSIGILRWKTPAKFKEWLGLERNAMVPVDEIGKVAEALDISITVTDGGYTYESDHKTSRGIVLDLVLEKNHYRLATEDEVRTKKQKWMPKGATSTGKSPFFYYFDRANKDNPIQAYIPSNKQGRRMISVSEGDQKNKQSFSGMRAMPRTAKHSLVYVKVKLTSPEEKKKEQLKAFAKDWIESQKALFEATDGEIDLFRYGSWSMAAKCLWRPTALQYHPDMIDIEEARWLTRAKNGPILKRRIKPYEGQAVKQDANSFYPSIMSRPDFLMPMKKPDFVTLGEDQFDAVDVFPVLGIYRCEIDSGDSEELAWVPQENSHYTNYDLIFAKQRGFAISLIQDGKPNAMLYTHGRASGKHLFGKYIDKLYELKKNGVKGAKNLLNTLWGSLSECSEKSKPKKYSVKEGKEFTLRDGLEIVEIEVIDGVEYITVQSIDRQYETPFARIKPFMTSAGRLVMGNLLYDHQDKLLRVHTDGFISTEKLEFTEEEDKMSEGTGLCQIKVEQEGHFMLKGTSLNDFYWASSEE